MKFPGLISIKWYRTDTLLGVANSLGTQKVLESFESMKENESQRKLKRQMSLHLIYLFCYIAQCYTFNGQRFF